MNLVVDVEIAWHIDTIQPKLDNNALNRSVLCVRIGKSPDGRSSHCIRQQF